MEMRKGRNPAKFAPSPNRDKFRSFVMSAFRFFKADADAIDRVLVLAAFAIVMLVTLGVGRPAHAMPCAMTSPSWLFTSLR